MTIKDDRLALGMTQDELADILGVSLYRLKRWEGDHPATVDGPSRVVLRMMEWLKAGWRPPADAATRTIDNVAAVRQRLGLSQAGLGRVLNQTSRAVRYWENEGRELDSTTERALVWIAHCGFRPKDFNAGVDRRYKAESA